MAHSITSTASRVGVSKAILVVVLVLAAGGCALTAPGAATGPPASAPPDPGSTASPAPAPGSATVDEIERLRAAIDADPSDAGAQRDLGFALLQRVRETADPSLYAPAEAAFERARRPGAGRRARPRRHRRASSSASTTSRPLSRPRGAPSTWRRGRPSPGPSRSTPSSSSGGTTRPTKRPRRCWRWDRT